MKGKFDPKGEANAKLVAALDKEFDLVASPTGAYARVLRGKTLAGWFTAGKKGLRIRVGGGSKDSHAVTNVTELRAVMKRLAAKTAPVAAGSRRKGKTAQR